jgi:hypothetical protein
MSTNAYILNSQGIGRYVHWDGHPDSLGVEIWRLVQRDGIDRARTVLLSYHWSSVHHSTATREQILAAKPDDDAQYATAGWWARHWKGESSLSSVVQTIEPGYGQFYKDDADVMASAITKNYGFPEYLYYLGDVEFVVKDAEGHLLIKCAWEADYPTLAKLSMERINF